MFFKIYNLYFLNNCLKTFLILSAIKVLIRLPVLNKHAVGVFLSNRLRFVNCSKIIYWLYLLLLYKVKLCQKQRGCFYCAVFIVFIIFFFNND